MLVSANLNEHKVRASLIHGKLVKCPEQIFDYLFLCSRYQHTNALKQATYLICTIRTQCNRQSARMLYLVHIGGNIVDLIIAAWPALQPFSHIPVYRHILLNISVTFNNFAKLGAAYYDWQLTVEHQRGISISGLRSMRALIREALMWPTVHSQGRRRVMLTLTTRSVL